MFDHMISYYEMTSTTGSVQTWEPPMTTSVMPALSSAPGPAWPYLKPVPLTQAPTLILSGSNLYKLQIKACWFHSFKLFSGFPLLLGLKENCLTWPTRALLILLPPTSWTLSSTFSNILFKFEGQIHSISYMCLSCLCLLPLFWLLLFPHPYSCCLNLD